MKTLTQTIQEASDIIKVVSTAFDQTDLKYDSSSLSSAFSVLAVSAMVNGHVPKKEAMEFLGDMYDQFKSFHEVYLDNQ
jgi:hypothetical protein